MKLLNLFNWVENLVGFFTFNVGGGGGGQSAPTTQTVNQVSIPPEIPVTTPVPATTVAIPVLLLLHVPPAVPSVTVIVEPTHTYCGLGTKIADGFALTVIPATLPLDTALLQPEPLVIEVIMIVVAPELESELVVNVPEPAAMVTEPTTPVAELAPTRL